MRESGLPGGQKTPQKKKKSKHGLVPPLLCACVCVCETEMPVGMDQNGKEKTEDQTETKKTKKKKTAHVHYYRAANSLSFFFHFFVVSSSLPLFFIVLRFFCVGVLLGRGSIHAFFHVGPGDPGQFCPVCPGGTTIIVVVNVSFLKKLSGTACTYFRYSWIGRIY